MESASKFSAAQKARIEKRWAGKGSGNAEIVPDGYRGDTETMPGEYPKHTSHSHSQTPQPKPGPKPKPQPENKSLSARLSARHDKTFDFESFKAVYPKRPGGQRWSLAIKRANARIEEGATFQDMIDGACGYAAYCDATEKTGTQYVMQAATFLGPDTPFLDTWEPPLSKADALADRNRQHAIDFLERDDK